MRDEFVTLIGKLEREYHDNAIVHATVRLGEQLGSTVEEALIVAVKNLVEDNQIMRKKLIKDAKHFRLIPRTETK